MNARGLRDTLKRNQILSYFKSKFLDIVLVQETHGTPDVEKQWCAEWGGKICFSHHNSASRGVMILCSRAIIVRKSMSDNNGRWILAEIEMGDTVITIVNVYAPNTEREQIEFFDDLNNDLVARADTNNMVIGGDFNVHLEKIDKKGSRDRIKKSKQNITNIMNNCNLIDIWREKHKSTKQFTWENKTVGVMTRLDYFLISNILRNEVKACDITESILTDHKMVILEIGKESKNTRGPGFWKFNNSLLQDETYNEKTTSLINNCWDETNGMEDTRVRWDFLKLNIQSHTIKYSKQKAKVRRELEVEVTEQLDKLHKEQCGKGLNIQQEREMRELKNVLENLYIYKERGAQIRSRVDFIENNEKSNKYFYNQERQQYSRKIITKLDVDGKTVTQEKMVLKELGKFYKTLFSSKYQETPSFTDTEELDDLPSLMESGKKRCDMQLSAIECKAALLSMNRNKSPGCDGLTVEFFERFWEVLQGKLMATLEYVKRNGELSTSQKRGVITLLAKKGKDEAFIKNWRPVSLLNIDYKILTKTLAKRVSEVIPTLVHTDQKGFIKGRYIGENIRQAQDIIEASNRKKKTGLMLLLDFEKAFDSIEWPFMVYCLKKFNFGEEFIQWIRVCYKNVCSTVINNGYSCGWFEIKRGVRQGDPLSSHLFLLCVEILAQTIRENRRTKGIVIDGHNYKISLFADDATCYIRDEESLALMVRIIEKFSIYSGLKLNIDKSLLVYLGPWKVKQKTIHGIAVEQNSFNILAIQIGGEDKDCYEINFENKLQSMKRRLDMWSARSLTILGKVLISKSMGISNLVYSLSCMDCKEDTLKQAQTIVNNFIWQKKPPKIKHTAMVADYGEWGLKSPDIASIMKSLRLAWIARLKNHNGTPSVINGQLKPYGGINLLLQCNYDHKLLELPNFYKNIFKYYDEIRDKSTCQGVLWNNKEIKINKKMVFIQKWFDKGIVYIHQLVEKNSVISMQQIQTRFNIENVPILTYYAIKATILKWLRMNNTNLLLDPSWKVDIDSKSLIMEDRILIAGTAKCKDYYKSFISKIVKPPAALPYWRNMVTITPNITNSFINARLAMKETQVLATQFKILHNTLAIGKNLKKWGIQETDNCKLCGEMEDIVHVFWDCIQTKAMYTKMRELIDRDFFNTSLQSVETIIFGVPDIQANNLLLIVKHTLYQRRRTDTNFEVECFRKELTVRMLSDKRFMTQNAFRRKWSVIEHVAVNLHYGETIN